MLAGAGFAFRIEQDEVRGILATVKAALGATMNVVLLLILVAILPTAQAQPQAQDRDGGSTRPPLGISPSEQVLDPEIGIPEPRRGVGSVQLPYQSFEELKRNPNPMTIPGAPETSTPGTSDAVRPLTELLQTDLRPREISLREAIQVSLMKSDVVRTLGSAGVQIESVTPFDPMILRLKSDVTATVFDPKVTAGYLGSRINEPNGTFFGPGIAQQTRRDEGNLTASLSKLWATGGSTTAGYLPPLGYLFYPNGDPGVFNPVYTSDLVIQHTQPLMRGAGTAVNLAPIRISQLKAEQSAWDCKQAILAQVRSVESAYWDLQASLVTLNALEAVLPYMGEIVRIEELRAASELSTHADVARASMQFDLLRQQQIQARNDALSKELRLRNLLAIDLSDGTRLVPIDLPRATPVVFEHANAIANAVERRPDLVRQRLGVRIREYEFIVARNGLKPQFDLQALYRSNGIGQELAPSLQQMLGFNYSDWTLGATFSIPLGNRAAKSNLMAAEFQLSRDRAVLNQAIQNISFTLADQMREATAAFGQYQLSIRRLRNSREWISAAKMRYSVPPPAADGNQNWLLLALYDYQNALKMHVDATNDAGQLLAKYNTQLAKLEEAQGTLLESRGIELTDDPCEMVQKNAAKLFGPDRLLEFDGGHVATVPRTPATSNVPPSNSPVMPTATTQNLTSQSSRPAVTEEIRVNANRSQHPAPISDNDDISDRRSQIIQQSYQEPLGRSSAKMQVSPNPKQTLSSVVSPSVLPPAGHSLEAQQIANGTIRPKNFTKLPRSSQAAKPRTSQQSDAVGR